GEQIAIMELEASGDSLEDMARLAPALQWDHAAELVERAGHCVERIADTEGSMRSSDRPLSPDFLPMAAETARRGAIALNKIHGSMPPHGIGRARVSLLTLADRLTALREGLFMPASDRRPPDDI
ncbi:MAG: hypothetical protein WCG78_07620, partial [Candidatus Omnitrophota bacterium]